MFTAAFHPRCRDFPQRRLEVEFGPCRFNQLGLADHRQHEQMQGELERSTDARCANRTQRGANFAGCEHAGTAVLRRDEARRYHHRWVAGGELPCDQEFVQSLDDVARVQRHFRGAALLDPLADRDDIFRGHCDDRLVTDCL